LTKQETLVKLLAAWRKGKQLDNTSGDTIRLDKIGSPLGLDMRVAYKRAHAEGRWLGAFYLQKRRGAAGTGGKKNPENKVS
jgi:hypothetical protein